MQTEMMAFMKTLVRGIEVPAYDTETILGSAHENASKAVEEDDRTESSDQGNKKKGRAQALSFKETQHK